ncbi:MAG: PAS domain S-box protein [Bacteroidetes bacterium]|nr:PAS domain S-box protein [Bacteroidota bacterium]
MDIFSDNITINDLDVAIQFFNESRSGFLKLFNNSPVCMSMTTTTLGKRSYRRVNQKFLEKFGYTEEEIIGKTSVEVGILDEAESLRVRTLIEENGRLQNDYVKCIAKDGSIVHTVSSIETMEMNGETYLVSFFIDVTKIMEQQSIIQQHARQLEAVNKELEAFSYSVSHDLRAPLRAINGYTQILEEEYKSVLDEYGQKALQVVQTNAKKMGNLIDDLLTFARLGKKSLSKSMIDMQQLVNEVIVELRTANPFNAEIKLGTLQSVKGDYALMKQVMLNLISNAIKYSSKKEHPVVEIYSETTDDHIRYVVKDNGAGFDMKYAAKLFGVFQRLHSNDEFEGTGVGLANVQRIINKHGGSIQANAELEKGAIFTFLLPVNL